MLYLVSPSEQTGCVDVGMRIVLIIRDFDVVPHAVVYPRHYASGLLTLVAGGKSYLRTVAFKNWTTVMCARLIEITPGPRRSRAADSQCVCLAYFFADCSLS